MYCSCLISVVSLKFTALCSLAPRPWTLSTLSSIPFVLDLCCSIYSKDNWSSRHSHPLSILRGKLIKRRACISGSYSYLYLPQRQAHSNCSIFLFVCLLFESSLFYFTLASGSKTWFQILVAPAKSFDDCLQIAYSLQSRFLLLMKWD